MLDFKDIQSTARTTIAAGAFFADQSVIADNGTALASIQNALGPAAEGETAAKGFVISVGMPTTGRFEQQGKGVALVYAKFWILVAINPDANDADTGAGIDLLEAVQNVVALLTAYTDDAGDHFELSKETFQLVDPGEGWFGYMLEVEKLVALS